MMAVWPILHEISVLGSHGAGDCSRPQSRIATIPGSQAISLASFSRCASRLIDRDDAVNTGVNTRCDV